MLGLGDRDLLSRDLSSLELFLLTCLGGEWEELLEREWFFIPLCSAITEPCSPWSRSESLTYVIKEETRASIGKASCSNRNAVQQGKE